MSRLPLTTACVGMLLGLALLGVARASTQEPVAVPAKWFDYDVLVELQDLPCAYTCDDLWYKFREVLLTIGAAPDVDVMPLRCGRSTRSPQVQVRFSLPHVLQAKFVRYSTIQAVMNTVELRPGHPTHLNASDCALVAQMKDTLFSGLPIRVVNTELPCGSSVGHGRAFSLSLQTLRAAPEGAPYRRARDGLRSPPRESTLEERHG